MARKDEGRRQASGVAEVVWSGKKILGMKRYAGRADLLSVILKPEGMYTLEAVDSAIADFMKGRVN